MQYKRLSFGLLPSSVLTMQLGLSYDIKAIVLINNGRAWGELELVDQTIIEDHCLDATGKKEWNDLSTSLVVPLHN